jgi:hypothetical protein
MNTTQLLSTVCFNPEVVQLPFPVSIHCRKLAAWSLAAALDAENSIIKSMDVDLNIAAFFPLMSPSYARWALVALLLLSSTTFAQNATIEIPYNDPRVTYTQKSHWYVNKSL